MPIRPGSKVRPCATRLKCRHCERRVARAWSCRRNGASVHLCGDCWQELFGRPPSGQPVDLAAALAILACCECGADLDVDWYSGACPECGADQFEDVELPPFP